MEGKELTWGQRGRLWLRLGIRLAGAVIAVALVVTVLPPLLSLFIAVRAGAGGGVAAQPAGAAASSAAGDIPQDHLPAAHPAAVLPGGGRSGLFHLRRGGGAALPGQQLAGDLGRADRHGGAGAADPLPPHRHDPPAPDGLGGPGAGEPVRLAGGGDPCRADRAGQWGGVPGHAGAHLRRRADRVRHGRLFHHRGLPPLALSGDPAVRRPGQAAAERPEEDHLKRLRRLPPGGVFSSRWGCSSSCWWAL